MTDEAHATDQAPVDAPESIISRAEEAAAHLEKWFATHIHNSAISAKMALYNEVHAVKERLKEFLAHLDA
jgi:hypothetical protein